MKESLEWVASLLPIDAILYNDTVGVGGSEGESGGVEQAVGGGPQPNHGAPQQEPQVSVYGHEFE